MRGPSDKQEIKLCCDAENATTVKAYMKSFYDTPFYISCQRMLRPPFHCLKCASSIIPLPIFKPCFGKCILYHTSVIDYALLSAIIVYNTPQSSTGWKHIYYRQWCQCWSVLIGLLEKKKRQKGICFQRLVRLVLEVTSWCFSPCVGIQLPALQVPVHSGLPP